MSTRDYRKRVASSERPHAFGGKGTILKAIDEGFAGRLDSKRANAMAVPEMVFEFSSSQARLP